MAEALASNVVPAPYRITENDKRGLVMVITSVTISFVLSCLLVRIYVRTKVKEWKRDDSLLAVATVFCVFQAITVYVQVREGLGLRHLDPAKLDRLGKANFAQQMLFTFTLFLSKCVVLLLYLRLTAGRKHAMLAYVTIALCAAWTVLSFAMISIPCNPVGWFTKGVEVCGDITWRWVVIGVTDIFTELIIFFNAIFLVAGLHMTLRLKAIVILAFSIRLPVIIACAIRLKFIRGLPNSADSTFDSVYSVVAGQFQLDFAVMASTISCIGPFLRPFEKDGSTSYRQRYYAEHPSAQQSHPSQTRSHGRSFNDQVSFGTAIKMGPVVHGGGGGGGGYAHHKHKLSLGRRGSAWLGGSGNHGGGGGGSSDLELDLRPDFFEHTAGAARGSGAGASAVTGRTELDQLSLESNDSRKMIIAKKTTRDRRGWEEEECRE
ncbi:hypothetical protein GTA08_BOTSDO00917 [Neofusicoccum parvum]|uniref:Uncharacterized protein n=1 Tax=Neofusicoccum parvum TaxID=310453 RepID=A0ACB5S216_9PEZI|nr:hypothetical protein GTA08_BOTSDO00917 [Neofusicoccum parvum]